MGLETVGRRDSRHIVDGHHGHHGHPSGATSKKNQRLVVGGGVNWRTTQVWYFLFFKNLLGVAMVAMVAMASLARTKALSNAQASAAAAGPRDGSDARARLT